MQVTCQHAAPFPDAGRPYKIPQLMTAQEGERTQLMRILVSRGIGGIDERTRGFTQRWFDMVDWRSAQVGSARLGGACRAALQNCAGHGARFFHAAAARAGARRFNRARAHIPGTDHASPSGRPRAPHAAVPSAALHLPGHFANCQAPKISVLRIG
jgi:hypothetical protein